MRTLKKTLCLVLCLAMMVGLCAFGANAAFSDATEIEHKDEVNLLTGIGVIQGMDDGTFNPNGTLTRAQAATIACRLLGYENVAASSAVVFTDVPATHWAAGYIALCASQGIVAGYGDGRFGPEDLLTAEAWQKILLCTLGYNAKAEGMEGNSWEIGVAKLVKKTNLTDGISLNPMANINRDQACKLAFNALTIPSVEYTGGLNISTSDGTSVSQDANCITDGTYLAENFGLSVPTAGSKEFGKKDFKGTTAGDVSGDQGTNSVFTGVITKNSANANTKKTYLNGNGVGSKYEFNVETGSDLLGHYVKLFVSTKKDAQGNYPVYSVVDIGKNVFATAITNDTAKFIKAFGTTAIDASQTAYFFNAANTEASAVTPSGAAVGLKPSGAPTVTLVAATYVLSEDNVVKAVINSSYSVTNLSKVTAMETASGKETITLAGIDGGKALYNGKIDATTGKAKDIVNEYDGIAVGDIVFVTTMGSSLTDKIYSLEKAKTVSGQITSVDTSANPATVNTLTIDGKNYTCFPGASAGLIVGNVVKDVGYTGGKINLQAAELKNNKYTLYVNGRNQYIACVLTEGSALASDALYVITTYQKTDTSGTYGDVVKTYAQTVGLDGKVENILIGSGTVGKTSLLPGFYTFAVDTSNPAKVAAGVKDDTPVALSATATAKAYQGDLNANTDFKSTTKYLDGAVDVGATTLSRAYLQDSTNFVFAKGSGATLKVNVVNKSITTTLDYTKAHVLLTKDTSGNWIIKGIVYLDSYTNTAVDPATALYVASTSQTGTNANGLEFAAYKADTGERITITTTATGVPSSIGFYGYSVKDGVYTLTKLTADSVKVDVPYSSRIGSTIVSNAPYNVTADTASALFIDTRPATIIKDEGELTTVDAIAAAAATGTVKFSALLNGTKDKASIIFIQSYT